MHEPVPRPRRRPPGLRALVVTTVLALAACGTATPPPTKPASDATPAPATRAGEMPVASPATLPAVSPTAPPATSSASPAAPISSDLAAATAPPVACDALVTTPAQTEGPYFTAGSPERSGRTEHIHVKVTPPGGETLTTQLYFPGVAENDADGIFDPAGLLQITETAGGLVGFYTFVL